MSNASTWSRRASRKCRTRQPSSSLSARSRAPQCLCSKLKGEMPPGTSPANLRNLPWADCPPLPTNLMACLAAGRRSGSLRCGSGLLLRQFLKDVPQNRAIALADLLELDAEADIEGGVTHAALE